MAREGARLTIWAASRVTLRNGPPHSQSNRQKSRGSGHPAPRSEGPWVKFDRRVRHATCFGTAALTILMSVGATGAAHAQGKLDAHYTITLAGVPVGRGHWVIEIADDTFTTAASGQTAGLMKAFSSGRGQSTARGTIVGGQLVPAAYTSSIHTDNRRYDEVRMALSGGNVEKFVAEPPALSVPNRVPIADAHRKGVADPMS